jgi:hypothetical protein
MIDPDNNGESATWGITDDNLRNLPRRFAGKIRLRRIAQ